MKPPPLTEKQKITYYRNRFFIKNQWDIGLYSSLKNAKNRCTNKKHKSYSNYGGRGIQWKLGKQKEAFLVQKEAYYKARRKHPNKRIEINRIDNNGHYEEGNIEWVTAKENRLQQHKDNPLLWKSAQQIAAKARRMPVVDCRGNHFESSAKVEQETGIPYQFVLECCRGERQSAGKYEDDTPRQWSFAYS